jgi:hypothetical protein
MIPTIEWCWEDCERWTRTDPMSFLDLNGGDPGIRDAIYDALVTPGAEIRCGGGARPCFLIRAAEGGAR